MIDDIHATKDKKGLIIQKGNQITHPKLRAIVPGNTAPIQKPMVTDEARRERLWRKSKKCKEHTKDGFPFLYFEAKIGDYLKDKSLNPMPRGTHRSQAKQLYS